MKKALIIVIVMISLYFMMNKFSQYYARNEILTKAEEIKVKACNVKEYLNHKRIDSQQCLELYENNKPSCTTRLNNNYPEKIRSEEVWKTAYKEHLDCLLPR